jgi:hypothetical protein
VKLAGDIAQLLRPERLQLVNVLLLIPSATVPEPIDGVEDELEMLVRRAVGREADGVFPDANHVVDLGSRVKVSEARWRKHGANLRVTVSEQVR